MATPNQAPVIVIGGSLVGLASALFLSARNVPLILIERHPASSPHPRALGYTTRTLELLQAAGIDLDSLRGPGPRGGKPRRIKVKSLAGDWADEQHWSNGGAKPAENGNGQPGAPANGHGPGPGAGPTNPGGKSYAPIMGTAIAQDRLEPILRKRAVELGADLRLGWKMTSWSQTEDGVTVTAVNKQGEEFTAEGSYIVACDGAHTVFRKDLGIATTGVGHLRSLCSILFRCPAIEHFLEKGYVQFSIEGRDDGFEAFLVTYNDGRWALMWNAEENTAKIMDERAQRDLIRKAVGQGENEIPDSGIELITVGHWDMSGRIADRFSSGRVFLAGDAAHTLPPNRGGYGANTGFADAHNLAWKIAAVRRGEADPAILDTYDAERRPVALVRHDQLFARDDYKTYTKGTEWANTVAEKTPLIDDIAMELGQIYRSEGFIGSESRELPDAMRPDEWKGQPGTRAAHIPLRRGDEDISSLDLFGKGWVLVSKDQSWKNIAEKAGSAHKAACDSVHFGAEVKEADESETFEEVFGVTSSGAVLVRPDGFIAWKTAEKQADAESSFLDVFSRVSFARK
ncbi:2,4-dichlorophenol 6-monooxygenase (FAD binding domain-containing protein) [Colletotrichum plurivorum]|uniref:2,4-dichlorophenol 6-monooxygenase (FAD binding domain-containing protein) n=1 Tax=Colletotrichum plurivorum TaxID=2175906 RepID=A0A8H6JJ96_9PEZI|nr:2,4-dichlorophenol 6-monooxygenase (FAD binding domain-containing protein) [Colletotrichum plurivorum]